MRETVDVVLDYLLRVMHVPIQVYENQKLVCHLGQQTGEVALVNETVVTDDWLLHVTSQYPQLRQLSDGRSVGLVSIQKITYVLGPILIADRDVTPSHIQVCDTDFWLEGLCLLHNVLHGSNIRPSDLYIKNKLSRVEQEMNAVQTVKLFETNQENTFIHNPYDQELRELNSVATGDIEGLQESLHESFEGAFARLGPNELRSMKNLAIVDLALLARAAIRGGLNYEQSFTINDQYINSVELARSIQDVGALGLQAKMEYTQLVHDIRNKATSVTNRIIRKSQTYIQTHLHTTLTLNEVSKHCDVSPQYLSRLFKQTQHVRFSEYVQSEKINASKRDLIYSRHEISTIAFDYNYSSASHYAAVFKNYVGLTPREFRDINGKV